MRLNNTTRFAHPVLRNDTSDYGDKEFTVELTTKEDRKTGKIIVEYVGTVNEPAIQDYIANDCAAAFLFIHCRRTYYSQSHPITLSGGSLDLGPGALLGHVTFRPIICAISETPELLSGSLHDEYQGLSFSFTNADVLAVGDTYWYDVGLDKLAPMETIFVLETLDEVDPDQTLVKLDGEKIAICANEVTKNKLHHMRNSVEGRHRLLNSVYLPALMQVLSSVATGIDEHEDKRWCQVLRSKATELNIDLESPSPESLRDAQKFLKSPLSRLFASEGN